MEFGFSKIVIVMTLLTKLSEHVKDLVKMVEEEDVEDGIQHGEEKKALILQIVEVAYDGILTAIGKIPLSKDVVLDLAGKLVDAFVSFFNAINVFKSKSK